MIIDMSAADQVAGRLERTQLVTPVVVHGEAAPMPERERRFQVETEHGHLASERRALDRALHWPPAKQLSNYSGDANNPATAIGARPSAFSVSWHTGRVHTLLLLAEQSPNPPLPGTNQGGSGVLSVILFLMVPVAAIIAGRYILGVRRSAEIALRRAAAAETEIRALRNDLR